MWDVTKALKTWAQVESRGHSTKNNLLMVSDWSYKKHDLESWEQTAFALRKEAVVKQNKTKKKPAQQLNKAPAVAWENNTPAIVQGWRWRAGNGPEIARSYKRVRSQICGRDQKAASALAHCILQLAPRDHRGLELSALTRRHPLCGTVYSQLRWDIAVKD